MASFTDSLFFRKYVIYVIPILSLITGIWIFCLSPPFHIKCIDPEFPYLVNGLNCALLHFDRIGHTDHPGTPFQLFCGLIIRMVHLVAGKGPVASDVFLRPDFYLSAISLIMTILQSFLLLWIGKTAIHGLKLPWVLILQLTPFFHETFFRLFERCIPERFMVLVMLLFLIPWIRFNYLEKITSWKFALWSGIILAMGFATKFNFLPVLILPLFALRAWKDRGIYVASGIASFFLFISPILNKFQEYRRFIKGIVQHEGLYGSGEEQVFNVNVLLNNLKEIFTVNLEIYLVVLFIVGILLVLSVRRFRKNKPAILLFAGFMMALILALLIVSKHFKNHYLIPFFLVYGLIMVESFRVIDLLKISKPIRYILTLVVPLVFLGLSTGYYIQNTIPDRLHDRYLREASEFVKKNPETTGYWYLKPSWQAAPCVENALIYGISYCAHRPVYEEELKKVHPRVITWEGDDKPDKIWRITDVSLDSVLRSGNAIRVINSPAQQGNLLTERIESVAASLGLTIRKDTLFRQEETQTLILRIIPVCEEKED